MRKLYRTAGWRRVLALTLAIVMMVSAMGFSGRSVFASGNGDSSVTEEEGNNGREAPEVIPDPETPAASANSGGWALINLLCIAVAAISATFALSAKKNEKDGDEDDGRAKRYRFAKFGAAAVAAAAIATFLLTEDLGQKMVMVDKWTLLMGLYAIGVGLFTYNARKGMDEEEQLDA